MADKLRRFLHILVAELVYRTGLLWVWRTLRRIGARRQEVCVLGLHRVLSERELAGSGSLAGMVLKEATFAKILEFLQRQLKVISLDEFLEGGRASNRAAPVCLLTFDDGWRDTYTNAYPWLKKFEAPAAVLVTTGWIEDRDFPWVEKLGAAWKDPTRRAQIQSRAGKVLLKQGEQVQLEETVEHLKHMSAAERRKLFTELLASEEYGVAPGEVDRMLSWDQVMALSRNGIEIGAHTVTHPLLPHEDDSTVERELRVSKQTLEEKLGKPVRAFAYPNGDLNDRIRGLVKEVGYQCAFTTRRGAHRRGDDPFTVRRYMIHEGNVTGWGGRFSPAMLSFTLARGRR